MPGHMVKAINLVACLTREHRYVVHTTKSLQRRATISTKFPSKLVRAYQHEMSIGKRDISHHRAEASQSLVSYKL